jgi:L-fuconolactonase
VKAIDTHAHFWDVSRLKYPWIERESIFDRTFSLEDYQRAAQALPISKMVFVECDADPKCSLEEVRWVEELARIDQRIQGIVAHVQLTDSVSWQADLESMADRPLVKGIRQNIQHHAPGFALQDSLSNGVRYAGKLGLHFELCLTHDQMAEAIDLVKRCPSVSFVLDHCGKPAIREGLREPWQTQMRELAVLPNVVCKISGLLTEADWGRWRLEDILWYADSAAESFGISRIMFGSDWPVNEAAGGYHKWYGATQALTEGWSVLERERFYYLNAETFYRL